VVAEDSKALRDGRVFKGLEVVGVGFKGLKDFRGA